MRERDVERLLVRAAEARGGLAWKFVSPGHTGVPDRLVLLPVPETHRDIVARYGSDTNLVPQALTDYIKGRQGYDYNEHGQAGNSHTTFVPDEIVDRFCIIGPPEEHIRRIEELKALGVHQYSVYLQHDDKEHTLQSYGERIMPAIADHVRAKS